MLSKAQMKANRKYDTKTYERLNLRIRKDGYPSRVDIHNAADFAHESVNEYVLKAVRQRIERDKRIPRFAVRDTEAGNIIETFKTYALAKEAIGRYEKEDQKEGLFQEGFYEIAKADGDTYISYEE